MGTRTPNASSGPRTASSCRKVTTGFPERHRLDREEPVPARVQLVDDDVGSAERSRKTPRRGEGPSTSSRSASRPSTAAITCSLPLRRREEGACTISGRSRSDGGAGAIKAAYVAAKHGIVGLTKVAALETAEEGITCNAICPGYVYTPLVEAQIDGQAKAHGISREQVIHDVLLAQQPNKRFATVEELGALTVFLASDAAASITGIALPVDGGWTAH